ncbi:hypothetical protein [Streptomyces avicenniae]|uniref:hypothetical protein n=1 Tax=Streptomyces avicenniae TaxID=500153 RepID=UPI000699A415|nr:hypothetical protein [Streptomyces avicenniae]
MSDLYRLAYGEEGPPAPAVHTRLNQDDGGGGALADLDIDTDALYELASEAARLFELLGQALPDLRPDDSEPQGLRPLASVTRLRDVADSWGRRLRDVQDECMRLQSLFTESADSFSETEAANRERMRDGQYGPYAAPSGQPGWHTAGDAR